MGNVARVEDWLDGVPVGSPVFSGVIDTARQAVYRYSEATAEIRSGAECRY